MVPFIRNSRKSQTVMTENRSVVDRGWEWREKVGCKRATTELLGVTEIYHGCNGYTTVNICQNSSNC